MDPKLMPSPPADQTHQADKTDLFKRLASDRVTHHSTGQIKASPEIHRAFIASLCAGMCQAAGKRT